MGTAVYGKIRSIAKKGGALIYYSQAQGGIAICKEELPFAVSQSIPKNCEVDGLC
jgi:hypothetical protein